MADSWSETVLYDFADSIDGAFPKGLISDEHNNLYGATLAGDVGACSDLGAQGCGLVFELIAPTNSSGAWTEKALYSFSGGADGGLANSVAAGEHGVLYGTTECGGVLRLGVVFSLTPPIARGGTWTESVLHSFAGTAGSDGTEPAGPITYQNGVIYGTTLEGGVPNQGTVFALKP
jgi:hypothetical protein